MFQKTFNKMPLGHQPRVLLHFCVIPPPPFKELA